MRFIVQDPNLSASKIAIEVSIRTHQDISIQTVRRIIKSNGYNSKTARSKPFISPTNQEKRLEFTSMYMHAPENFWQDVIFMMSRNSIFLGAM